MNEKINDIIIKHKFAQFNQLLVSGQLEAIQQYEAIHGFVYDILEYIPSDKQEKLLSFSNDYRSQEEKLAKVVNETGTLCNEVYEWLKNNYSE